MRYFIVLLFATLMAACGNSAAEESNSNAISTANSNASSRPAENPDITVQVEGASAGKAYLLGFYADQRFRYDSAIVDPNGTAHFKRDEPYRQGFYYAVFPDNSNCQLLITEDQTFSLKTKKVDPVGQMVVEGSLDNELLYQNLKFQDEQRPQFNRLASQLRQQTPGSAEYNRIKAEQDALLAEREDHLQDMFSTYPNSFFTIFKRAGQNPQVKEFTNPDGTPDNARKVWHYRTEFWEGVDFNDERLLYTPVIGNKLKRYVNELTPQNPDSIIASADFLIQQALDKPEYFKLFVNWITLNYEPEKTTLMDPQAVFVHMVQNYITYERAFWSDSVNTYSLQQRAYEMAASVVGKDAPNVTAKDPNGVDRTLLDLKSDYLLVYMFNPQCEHCAVETPKLSRNYPNWKRQGIDVYGIAIDTDQQEWRDYIRKNNMGQWTNVFDPTNKAIYAKYFVDVTPELYVIGPDRKIIAKNLKVDQVMEVINRDKAKRQGN